MKYFVFSDAHGYYDILAESLYRAGFRMKDPSHGIISLGDLIDRGSDPLGCLNFVNSLPEERKILIRGNHETLLDELMRREREYSYEYSNGTIYTLYELAQNKGGTLRDVRDVCRDARTSPMWLEYTKYLRDYAEIGDNIFVHGWIPCASNDADKYHTRGVKYTFDDNWRRGDWDTASWVNGMDAWNQGVKIPGKTIYCGHWHASYGHSKLHNEGPEFNNPYAKDRKKRKANFTPFIDEGICAMDACTAVSHKINIRIIDDECPDGCPVLVEA